MPAPASRFPLAWLALCLVLALPALALGWTDLAHPDAAHAAWLWRRDALAAQPWRLWTAAWVHGSATHLAANLLGVGVVAGLGMAARLPGRAAAAWAAAWPLTQVALRLDDRVTYYGGASGVVHAAVAVAAVHLLARPSGHTGDRWAGALLLGLLLAKVGVEAPWRQALLPRAALGLDVVPMAHAGGLMAGAACAALAEVVDRIGPRRGTPAGGA